MSQSIDERLTSLREFVNDIASKTKAEAVEAMSSAYELLDLNQSDDGRTEEQKISVSKELKEMFKILGDKAKEEEPTPVVSQTTTKKRKIPAKEAVDPDAETEVNDAVSSTDIVTPIPKKPKSIPKPVYDEPVVEETPSIEEKPVVEPPKPQPEEFTVVKEEETGPRIIMADEGDQMVVKDENEIITVDKDEENKPFEGDDDIDIDIDESKLDELVIEEQSDDKIRREKAIEERFSRIPEGMQIFDIKSVTRNKISETLRALSTIKTENVDLSRIGMYDYTSADEKIHSNYLKTRNDMISSPKCARTALLMSGHYEEISAYGNYDLVGIQRQLTNPDVSFVEREMYLFNTIYQHVKYVSYQNEKPDFETWSKNIMFPDIASLYWGVYDANSVGNNNYSFTCPFCRGDTTISVPNRDLIVAVPKELTKDQLDKFITAKEIMKLDSTPIAKWAHTTTIRKLLKDSKIIVDFAVPSLYDYIVTINTLQRINDRDGNDMDISVIDVFNATVDDDALITRIMTYLYVKQIAVPTIDKESHTVRYMSITSKADIIEFINSVSKKDYDDLATSQNVQELMVRTATRYYLQDSKCSNEKCGKTIKYITVNPKQIFFFKIGEAE